MVTARKRRLWTPAEITTEGWWDASDTDTITHDTGEVSQIDDLSGNSQHLTMVAGSSQPTTGVRTLNSLNVLEFDGNDRLRDYTFSLTSGGDCAVWSVMEVDAGGINNASDSAYALNSTTGTDFQLDAASASQFNGTLDTNAGGANIASISGGWPYSGPSIYNCNFDWSGLGEYNMYFDGTEQGSNTNYNTQLGTSFELFWMTNRAEARPIGGISGELIISTDVSESTRQKMEGYLAHKWGLTANLPSGHPYKSVAPTV
jgi:hypothetical protein